MAIEDMGLQPTGSEAIDPAMGIQLPEAVQHTGEDGSRIRSVGRAIVEAAIVAVPFGANLAAMTGLRGLGLAQRGIMHMGTSSGDQDVPW